MVTAFFTKSDDVMNLWMELFPVQELPSIDQILLANEEQKKEWQGKTGIDPEKGDCNVTSVY